MVSSYKLNVQWVSKTIHWHCWLWRNVINRCLWWTDWTAGPLHSSENVFVLERHLQTKKALQRPEKLLAAFQTVNGSLEGLFSWQVSETTPGQTPITGFQFSWVKVSSSRVNKSPDSLISQTLNLAPVSLKFYKRECATFLTNSFMSWRKISPPTTLIPPNLTHTLLYSVQASTALVYCYSCFFLPHTMSIDKKLTLF